MRISVFTGTPRRYLVWQELVRMAVTWGVMVGLVAFFYWMLANIGTF
jgi:hypothetical protein